MYTRRLIVSWAFLAEDFGENPLENTVFTRFEQRKDSFTGVRLCTALG